MILRRERPAPLHVRELIHSGGVLLQADITGIADVLGILVELQEKSGAITNGTAYYHALRTREDAGGTAVGGGVALPHAVSPGVERLSLAALTLRKPINWEAGDGIPVDLVFMLAVPPGAHSDHLMALARLVNLLSRKEVANRLRRETSRQNFVQTLARAERERFV